MNGMDGGITTSFVSIICRAIANESFTEQFALVIRNIGVDARCEVHSCVLAVRDHKDGWLHLYAQGAPLLISMRWKDPFSVTL